MERRNLICQSLKRRLLFVWPTLCNSRQRPMAYPERPGHAFLTFPPVYRLQGSETCPVVGQRYSVKTGRLTEWTGGIGSQIG